jgi:hypothetical protein
MKTSFFAALAATALSLSCALAQQPVSTGIVEGITPKDGALTILSDQTHENLSFYGLEKATIFTADGKPLLLGDLLPGQRVTLEYAVRDNRSYVNNVILSEPRPEAPRDALSPAARERIRHETEGQTRTPSAPPTAAPVPPTRVTGTGAVPVTGP